MIEGGEKIQGTDPLSPRREKYWEELSIEEKIQRTHQVVRSLREEVSDIHRMLWEIHKMLVEHSHNGDKILVPMPTRMRGHEVPTDSKDNSWF